MWYSLEASHRPCWLWKQFELATTLRLGVQWKLLGGNDVEVETEQCIRSWPDLGRGRVVRGRSLRAGCV